MSEGFQLITPSGYIVDLDYTLRADGQVQVTPIVSQLLPGGSVNERGIGDHAVTNVSGVQGTIEATFTPSAPGTAQAVAFLVDSLTNPTKYIGIALDSLNRPYALLSVDGKGTVYALSDPSFSPLPAGATGVPIVCRLSFSSNTFVSPPLYASFEVGTDDQILGWASSPLTTWIPFTPVGLRIGVGIAGLADFTGKIGQVQVSPTVTVLTTPTTTVASGSVVATLSGSATFAPAIKATYAATAAITGTSSVTAVPTMTGP